jgi:hypothetical protein
MKAALKALRDRYGVVAKRYAQVTGQAPPPLVADPAELAETVRRMTDALNGRREPDAGPPTQILGEPLVTVRAEGLDVEVTLGDAEGRVAGARHFHMPADGPLKSWVKQVLDRVRELATERL